MSYLVLARKYRPKTFDEVAGQDSVKRTLTGAIEAGRIGHAYLFTGPRGTGKTTTARIFAKALNCAQGPIKEPCGTCERCLALDAGSEVDVVEIDAASNTSVDDVRVLRDQAAYSPMRARFKIFIIDEVHMLSKSAFNALLKTLEEPPPHVKFLFATTELHKVLDTILSRCQVLQLSPLPEETISARLDTVFAAEGVDAEAGVTGDLARRARGGMRDALSLADQLLAQVGLCPRLADCERLAGEGSAARVGALVECVISGDRAAVLNALPPVEGGENELVAGLLDHLRACLLAHLCGADAPMLNTLSAGGEARKALAARGERIGPRRLEVWLQELLHARERMRLLPAHARLTLEVTLLDLCRADGSLDLEDLARRLAGLEARLQGGLPPAPAAPTQAPQARVSAAQTPAPQEPPPQKPPPQKPPPRAAAPASAPAPQPATEPEPHADGELTPASARATARQPAAQPRVRTNSTADAWAGFLTELKAKSPSLSDLLERRGTLVQYGGGRAVVQLKGLGDGERPLIEDRRNQRSCTRAFTAAVGRDVEVELQDAAAAAPGKQDAFTEQVRGLFEGRIEE